MEGVVKRIATRNWTNPNGQNITFYSLQLDDGQYYSLGTKNPQLTPGTTVQFETYSKGEYEHVADNSLVVIGKGKQTMTNEERAFGDVATSKEEYWARKEAKDDERQDSIKEQSARKDALKFLDLAIQIDALPPHKSKKPGDKFDMLLALTESLSRHFLGEDDMDYPTTEETDDTAVS